MRRVFSDKGYSSVLTLGAGTQFFGFMMLIHKASGAGYPHDCGIGTRKFQSVVGCVAVRVSSVLKRFRYSVVLTSF